MQKWNVPIVKFCTWAALIGFIVASEISNAIKCPNGCFCTKKVGFEVVPVRFNDIQCFTSKWSSFDMNIIEWDSLIIEGKVINKKFNLFRITCKNLPHWEDFLNGTTLALDFVEHVIFSDCMIPCNATENSKSIEEILKQVNLKPEQLLSVSFLNVQSTLRMETLSLFTNVLEMFIDNNKPERLKLDFLQGMPLRGVETCTNQTPPFQLKELRYFKMGHNCITEAYIDVIYSNIVNYFPNMYELFLSGNDLSELKALNSENCHLPGIVNVSENNIRKIDNSILELLARARKQDRHIVIVIGENPIDCSCYLYPFLQYFKSDNRQKIDVNNTKCQTPIEMESVRLTDINPQEFTCRLINHNSNYDDPCSNEGKCSCSLIPHDNSIKVDCSSRNMTQLPNLKHLGSYSHILLNMEDNLLKNIFINGRSPELQNIQSLNLGMNVITDFDLNILPPMLKNLQLHGNELTALDPKILDILSKSNNVDVTLHDNPWRCDCSTLNFISFVESKVTRNARRIRCQTSGETLITLSKTTLCPEHDYRIILGIIFAILGLLLGFGVACYYRFRKKIQVWIWSNNICVNSVNEEDDTDWIYDIFISYSHKDEDFVVQELMPKLESGPNPYKVCVHFRDWLVGEYIPLQIDRSVRKSKWTILIVSPNFINSVWGKLEFQTAHRQALNKRKSRIIVIIYGDINTVEELDPELRVYININSPIKWGDPTFWEKLHSIL